MSTPATKTDAKSAPAPEGVDAISSEEIGQAFRLLRFKFSQLRADARRRVPFMSRSKAEAEAKYVAAYKTISELADFLDKQSTV